MAENTNKKPSIWSRMGKFFKDCKSEFKKLVWPTKQQLLKNSALVLVSIVVVGACLALVDFGLNKGVFALKDLIDYIRPVS
ncbi:MAG: preprotein translocase subunit SecE [Clostridia bacterium]|jgi:preprotein translocase subunit SecE|nr:preprotein translocase subunit SecE [Clostridia bacterium]